MIEGVREWRDTEKDYPHVAPTYMVTYIVTAPVIVELEVLK